MQQNSSAAITKKKTETCNTDNTLIHIRNFLMLASLNLNTEERSNSEAEGLWSQYVTSEL